jgi:hypothetical protein
MIQTFRPAYGPSSAPPRPVEAALPTNASGRLAPSCTTNAANPHPLNSSRRWSALNGVTGAHVQAHHGQQHGVRPRRRPNLRPGQGSGGALPGSSTATGPDPWTSSSKVARRFRRDGGHSGYSTVPSTSGWRKHAMLAQVQGLMHCSFRCQTGAGTPLITADNLLPSPVPEATGPADRW